jgi:hypothetical protein
MTGLATIIETSLVLSFSNILRVQAFEFGIIRKDLLKLL